jgi:diguanylate cyclase (GGDEF)-like protein
MDGRLLASLTSPANFATPPGVAQQIISLSNDPEVEIAALAEAISKDPALSIKLLRIANSALYARRRRSDNLRQALMVLGLKAATTLALSFSLVPIFHSAAPGGLDYTRLWRRALLSAISCRALGEMMGLAKAEELFLAGLLQDFGMLAIDRIEPGFYKALPGPSSHEDVWHFERERLGLDHAAIGALIVEHWKLPAYLAFAIGNSHTVTLPTVLEGGEFYACVALSSLLADLLLADSGSPTLSDIELTAESLLGLSSKDVGETLMHLMQLLPEVERLFDVKLLDPTHTQVLMDQARELLTLRSLESLSQLSRLESRMGALEERTDGLQEQSRRDSLTGLFNRGYVEMVLAREFSISVKQGWPLAVIFLDLDHFKAINDQHGHAGGDTVLQGAARVLSSLVRDCDLVGRFGGEEFVIVLPGANRRAADALCTRIVSILRSTTYQLPKGVVSATASLGIAVQSETTPYVSAEALLKAADEALYRAKQQGRDRYYGPEQ